MIEVLDTVISSRVNEYIKSIVDEIEDIEFNKMEEKVTEL